MGCDKPFSEFDEIDQGFEIEDWKDYPEVEDVPKPEGPFHLLDSTEYEEAREAANRANTELHQADPSLKGKEIHEIHPVKFGGDPVDPSNKVALSREDHMEFTKWWNRLQNDLEKMKEDRITWIEESLRSQKT